MSEEIDIDEKKAKINEKWNNLNHKSKKIIVICLVLLCVLLIWYFGLNMGAKLALKETLKNCLCYP